MVTTSSAARLCQDGTRYTRLQVGMHWAVVLLLVEQWYTSQAIPRTHNPLLPASDTDLFLHAVHNYAGLLIGALMLMRIGLRFLQPVPQLPQAADWRERVAQAVHWGLYLSLLGQVAAGFVTAYLWAPAGRIHVFLWNVTLVLVGLHVAAALYHAVRQDDVIRRMFPWMR